MQAFFPHQILQLWYDDRSMMTEIQKNTQFNGHILLVTLKASILVYWIIWANRIQIWSLQTWDLKKKKDLNDSILNVKLKWVPHYVRKLKCTDSRWFEILFLYNQNSDETENVKCVWVKFKYVSKPAS